MGGGPPLADEPFSFQRSKDGRVRIFHRGRLAVTLKGARALKFLDRIRAADGEAAQLVMARATGQFKFGNERRSRR